MIRLENVSIQAGSFVLRDLNLTVPDGKYAVLMGPTGCGKTTLLEVLCGLRKPATGKIWLGERESSHLPPGERGIGYVPQDGALFPTLRVREQLGFALRVRGRARTDISGVVKNLAAQLGLKNLLERLPPGLSGGERQRVALGRALAANPRVLLIDEPLSALDEELRGEMIALLQTVQRENSLTVLHVTHSTAEAAALGEVKFRLENGAVREG